MEAGSKRFARRGVCTASLIAALFLIGGPIPGGAATFKIEIDYMVDTDHTHQPGADVLNAVIAMFACQGHTLAIDLSDAIPHHDVLRRDPDDCAASLFEYDGSDDSFGSLKEEYADHSSDNGWHYCIFAHQQEDTECTTSSSSGLAENPGWNFIVTLGSWPGQTGSAFEQAATLAHEFGHNLGLTHCGEPDCGGIGNFLPILPSTMSYRYQLVGVRTNLLRFGLTIDDALFKEIDYSHGRMCSLNENDLNEFFGTGMIAVDWDCDGALETGVAHDINGGRDGWCNSSGTRSWVSDTNEWRKIEDPERTLMGVERREVSCITLEEWQDVQQELALDGLTVQATPIVEPCLQGENVYVGDWNLSPDFSCRKPARWVHEAHDGTPPGSRFFVLPGTYSETRWYGPIVLDRAGIWFCNVGTAVIQ